MRKRGTNRYIPTSQETAKLISTRDGFGDAMVEIGKKNKDIVLLCADTTESTRSAKFKEAFPERFIQIGVSEQSMAAIAGGLALEGKIPFIAGYAAFSPGRNWEQIRLCAAIQNLPIKIIGSHAGVSVGEDGSTHQMLEDIALMRVLPNMTVVSPCDYMEAKKAIIAASKMSGPVYIRLNRAATPSFTTTQTPFKIGKARILKDGNNIALVATGTLVYEALRAAQLLSEKGVDAMVINSHTIKPLDKQTIIAAAKKCKHIVTIEEAQRIGGLGGAVAECLGGNYPAKITTIGVNNRFGESGKAEELLEAFGLDAISIAKQVTQLLK